MYMSKGVDYIDDNDGVHLVTFAPKESHLMCLNKYPL